MGKFPYLGIELAGGKNYNSPSRPMKPDLTAILLLSARLAFPSLFPAADEPRVLSRTEKGDIRIER